MSSSVRITRTSAPFCMACSAASSPTSLTGDNPLANLVSWIKGNPRDFGIVLTVIIVVIAAGAAAGAMVRRSKRKKREMETRSQAQPLQSKAL